MKKFLVFQPSRRCVKKKINQLVFSSHFLQKSLILTCDGLIIVHKMRIAFVKLFLCNENIPFICVCISVLSVRKEKSMSHSQS